MRRNLYQRAHHEVAQVHQRVGQVQMGSVNRDRSAVCGVTEQQVDVNDAVVIDAVHRFGRTPHLAFSVVPTWQTAFRKQLAESNPQGAVV